MPRPLRIIGVSFDHMHMGDLLRQVAEHPGAEIAGLHDPDPARMAPAAAAFGLTKAQLFIDLDACLAATKPDLALVCSATADHASLTAKLAAHGVHVLVEKPFATSTAEARRMIAAMLAAGRMLAINWPAVWSPAHATAKRLIDRGLIGEMREVHYYGGNRGPLWHLADKVEVTAAEVERRKPRSWWYKSAAGGGSLRDYLGYGATLGTWFMDGRAPLEVTCTTDAAPGLEVDEHAIAVLRYETGLSRMETRWGTFTDPWTIQPQPDCGFVLVGSDGTLKSRDYDDHVTAQTRARPEPHPIPVEPLLQGFRNAIDHMADVLANGTPLVGPLDPAISLMGQRIVDTAVLSAREKRTLPLVR